MLLKLKNVSKFYYSKGVIATGFRRVNIEFDTNEFVVITGESGSGKSTLLNVISGLDSYEEGEMYINGEETSHYREIDFENYRKKYVSNIFQSFNLVNSYTVYQNIELVLLLNGYKRKEVKTKVLELIQKVNLTKYKNTKVSKLSGGQKQRVAIARALAKETPIIVCDEPTGNLDSKAAHEVIDTLKEISKDKLVIVVTHDFPLVKDVATRVVEMNDGKILSDKKIEKNIPNENIQIHENKGIGFYNIIRLGIRNTFNIIPKFVLMFFVFLFVTMSLLSEYGGLKKSEYELSKNGYNYYFHDTSETRIVINKKDHSIITNEDIDNIKKLSNVNKVVIHDIFLDNNYSFNTKDYNYYLNGLLKDISELKSNVDYGRMPENNDEVVVYTSADDYYFSYQKDEMLNNNFYIFGNTEKKPIKIVGIVYSQDSFVYDNYIYAKSDLIEEYAQEISYNYINTKLELNGKEIESYMNQGYVYALFPSKKVKKGEAYVNESLNYECKNYNCKKQNLKINVESLYFNKSNTLKITNIYNEDNVKSLLGFNKKDNRFGSIFINEEDYNNLYNEDIYQISVFADDKDNVTSLANSLEDLGYFTLEIRKSLMLEGETLIKVIKIFKLVMTILLSITLFFISYFVIKLILKSRNIYFGTLRILGANNKNMKRILDVELFTNASLAYIVYMIMIVSTNNGIIQNKTISDILSYLQIRDYILMYIILITMSYLISTRFARKIFKNSAMKAYKEEV